VEQRPRLYSVSIPTVLDWVYRAKTKVVLGLYINRFRLGLWSENQGFTPLYQSFYIGFVERRPRLYSASIPYQSF